MLTLLLLDVDRPCRMENACVQDDTGRDQMVPRVCLSSHLFLYSPTLIDLISSIIMRGIFRSVQMNQAGHYSAFKRKLLSVGKKKLRYGESNPELPRERR